MAIAPSCRCFVVQLCELRAQFSFVVCARRLAASSRLASRMSLSGERLQAIRSWLSAQLGPYDRRDLVYAHVDALLSTYQLSIRTANYVFEDGRSQVLLNLSGTLPIAYKSARYNIPLSMWIRYNHPTEPPIVYVTPTANMLVRPSRAVDVSGRLRDQRVEQPATYLEHWAAKPEACDLVRLAESLVELWSKEPPVYARPAEKPGTPVASTRPNAASPPPRPASIVVPQYAGPSATPSPTEGSYRRAPLPPGVQTNGYGPSRHASTSNADGRPPHPPHPPQYASPAPPRPPPARDLLDEDAEQPVASTSAGPAPARPLNPELLALRSALHAKLANSHAALHASHQGFAQRQAAFSADLAKGEPAILDEMARLEAVRDVCRHVGDRYGEIVTRAEAQMASVAERTDVPVDEIICASTVVGNQCVSCVAAS